MDFYEYEALFSRLFSSLSFPFFSGEEQGEIFVPDLLDQTADPLSFVSLKSVQQSDSSREASFEAQDTFFRIFSEQAFAQNAFFDSVYQKENYPSLSLDASSSFSSFPFWQKDESRQITENHTFSPNISVNATLSDQSTAQELISLIEDQLYRELLAMSEGGR